MRRRAALYALSLIALSGCQAVSETVAQQYAPVQPRHIVFYKSWSANLDVAGRAVVQRAAQQALKDPDAQVQVVGFSSPIGTDAANQALAEQRAKDVLTQLIADGVPQARIVTMARGATSYQLSAIESRRVEIDIIPAGF